MKTTLALLVLFVAILIGGYVFAGQQMTLARDSAGAVPTSYTSAQVAAHGTSQSCWTSINGSVYDLTAWISQHPGGKAAILSICGKDGTQAFETQHGRSTDTQPKQILATFRIGALAP